MLVHRSPSPTHPSSNIHPARQQVDVTEWFKPRFQQGGTGVLSCLWPRSGCLYYNYNCQISINSSCWVELAARFRNAQMQHRYDHFAADLHRNFGSSIARHVVLTDDLGPAELRKEINEMCFGGDGCGRLTGCDGMVGRSFLWVSFPSTLGSCLDSA